MAASPSAISTGAKAFLGYRLILILGALTGIIIMTGILVIFNYYWLGIIFCVTGIMLLISLMLEKYELRNLCLLLVLGLAVAVIVGMLTQQFLSSNPQILPITQSSDLTLLTISILIGISATIFFVVIPFLLLVGIATAGILKWHKDNGAVSFFEAYEHVLTDILGIFRLWVTVEDGKIEGDKKSKEYLERWGGPGWLTVYPGYVVVLHKWGKVSRAVGRGSTLLEPREQIKVILPLTTKGGINTVENVLTVDRIPLTIKVVHAVQLEPAADTKKRLQQAASEARKQLRDPENKEELEEVTKRYKEAQTKIQALENDKIIGDDYDQCYESVAKLAAAKAAPDIWESMKSSIGSNLRDIVMTCEFDELFKINNGSTESNNSVKKRKIAKLEEMVTEAVKGSGPGKGLVLRVVDISEVKSPEQVEQKLISEATELAERRIQNTKAHTEEATAKVRARILLEEAKVAETAAEHKSKATITIAEAEAKAELIRGRAKTQANAEYFRQIIRTLRAEGQTTDTIGTVVQGLTASIAAEEQWKQIIQLMVRYTRGEPESRRIPELSMERR
jgi:hypothetical protein